MAVSTGHKSLGANKIETNTTYGGAVIACTAGDKIPLLSESVSLTKNIAPDNELIGNAGRRTPTVISNRFGGVVNLNGRYRGLEQFLYQALGFTHADNSPIDVNGDATVYSHLFEIDDCLEIKAFKLPERNPATGSKIRNSTLCFDKQTSIFEFLSTRVDSITFNADASTGIMKVDVTVSAKSRDIASATNTASSGWTLPASSEIKFTGLVCRIRPVDEYTIVNASNDTVRFFENGANNIDITVDAGTYSGQELANEIARLMTSGTSNSISYRGIYTSEDHRFTFKNTNNAITFNMDISSMTMDGLLGYFQDQTAGLQIVGDTGGQFDNADLDTNDKISITSFSLTLNNNNANDDQTNDTGLNIEEPVRNNKFTTTLQINESRYSSNNIIKWVEEDTKLHCDLRFTGDTISGGQSEEFNLIVPEMQGLNENTNIQSAGILRPDYNFIINEPEKDFIPGLDDNAVASDSQYDKYLISQIGSLTAVSNTIVYDQVIYKGELYFVTGDTDAILAKYNFETDTLTDSLKDFTSYTKGTALAVGFGKLWIAVQDGTHADIYSFDGTTYTLETAAEFNTNTINALHYSDAFGTIFVGLADGDISSFDSTPTFTSRQTGGGATQDDVAMFAEDSGVLYSGGALSGAGKITSSSNGTSFANFGSTIASSPISGMEIMDGYIYALNITSTTTISVNRFEPVAGATAVVFTNADPIGAGQLKLFNGWLYVSGEDSSNNAVLFRADGQNQGSAILAKDNFSETKIISFEEYRGMLFIGTSGGADIWVYRPLRSLQIEVQNANATNVST